MKAILLFFIPLFSYYCIAHGSNTIFSQANEAYQKGNFSKAYDLYKQVSPKDSSVHYNLGNCAYKMNLYGYALLHWRRAENNWGLFGREELLNNINLVRKRIHHVSSEKSESPLYKLLDYFRGINSSFISMIRSTHLFSLQLLVLLLWILLFAYLKYLYRKKQKIVIISLFFLLALFGGMLAIKYSFSFRSFGIVVAKQTKLRSGPGKSYALLGLLPEAKECIIRGASGDFYKIKVDRQIGWVDAQSIEKI